MTPEAFGRAYQIRTLIDRFEKRYETFLLALRPLKEDQLITAEQHDAIAALVYADRVAELQALQAEFDSL